MYAHFAQNVRCVATTCVPAFNSVPFGRSHNLHTVRSVFVSMNEITSTAWIMALVVALWYTLYAGTDCRAAQHRTQQQPAAAAGMQSLGAYMHDRAHIKITLRAWACRKRPQALCAYTHTTTVRHIYATKNIHTNCMNQKCAHASTRAKTKRCITQISLTHVHVTLCIMYSFLRVCIQGMASMVLD